MRTNGMRWVCLALLASTALASLVGCRQRTTEAAVSRSAVSLQSRSSPTQAQPDVEGCFVQGQTDPGLRAWCLMKTLVTSNGDLVWQDWHPDPSAGLGAYPCPQSASQTGSNLGILSGGAPSADPQHTEFFKAMKMARQIRAAEIEVKPARAARPIAAAAVAAKAKNKASPAQSAESAAAATSQFAEIIYNDAAINSICGQVQRPQQASIIDTLNALARQAPPAAGLLLDQPFPVVIKTIWAKVPANSPAALMTIWDPKATNLDLKITPVLSVVKWNTLIRVDDTLTAPSLPNCGFQPPSDPHDYQGPHFLAVPLGCFYSLPVSKEENALIDRGRSGAVFHDDEPGPGGGFHLILLGFHVAAKGPDGFWTWQTFWWSAQGLKKGTFDYQNRLTNPFYDHTRPDNQQKPLAYYRMAAGGDPNSALYNPYLEARLPNGAQTSCAGCHAHAVFHASGPQTNPDSLFQQAQQCRVSPSSGSNQCPPIPGGVPTDNLWTLADSNVMSVNSPDGP